MQRHLRKSLNRRRPNWGRPGSPDVNTSHSKHKPQRDRLNDDMQTKSATFLRGQKLCGTNLGSSSTNFQGKTKVGDKGEGGEFINQRELKRYTYISIITGRFHLDPSSNDL